VIESIIWLNNIKNLKPKKIKMKKIEQKIPELLKLIFSSLQLHFTAPLDAFLILLPHTHIYLLNFLTQST